MKNTELLLRTEQAWNAMQPFRDTRRRNINYIYGDQWSDLVSDGEGHLLTERERITRRTGAVPLQNNHLIKIVHALTGLIAKRGTQPVCFARQADADDKSRMMTNALQANWEVNAMPELLVSQMEELMQGGLSVVCEEWGTHGGEADAYTYGVNPDYFFFESKKSDPRLWDVALIGEIRDYKPSELAARLNHSGVSPERLQQIYAPVTSFFDQGTRFGDNAINEPMDFFRPADSRLCRTYHVWTFSHRLRYRCVDRSNPEAPVFRVEADAIRWVEQENRRRERTEVHPLPPISSELVYDQVWRFTMLAPDGTVLEQHDSPYSHGEHPYVMAAYHFVNGNVYPFMSTVIDQQRYINRLITLNDLYINSSIKGLKMIPKRSIPSDMSLDDFARQAMEVGGWIVYEPDPTGARPEVINQSAMNLGVSEMLQLQLSSINEITSVNSSLQGVPPKGNTGYARYAMEMENSSTSVAALTHKFTEFERKLARKKMKVIHQFYQQPRDVATARTTEYGRFITYEPQAVADIDFKVSIQDNADSPVARMMTNDLVMQLWQNGAISADQLLQNLYIPGSKIQL